MSSNPFGRRHGRRTNRLIRRAQRSLTMENLEERQMLAADVLYRINAGGGTISDNPDWVAGSQYTNISTKYTVSNTIDLTDASLPVGISQNLFKSEIYDGAGGAEMQWNFAVTPGNVEVRLYFAEIYNGAQGVGKRVFDVTIEGQTVLDNYDIYADVGGYKGVMKSFTVASDSNLDIDFGHVVQNPAIKGIEILQQVVTANTLAVSSSSLDFPGTLVGNALQQSVTLTNIGDAGDPAITIDPAQLAITGSDASAFAASFDTNAPFALQPGESATLDVSFTADDASTKGALLSIPHSGDNTPLTVALSGTGVSEVPISFSKSDLEGEDASRPTSLQFGPDDRLYVAQQDGVIKVYSIERFAANDYQVLATETINLIRDIPNHNDDGSLNTSVDERLVTGLYVDGTATNPVIYVTSSDPRIGAGGSGADLNLDTNSGILSRLTWNGSEWEKLDLVRGLPRSEENHAPNGMAIDHTTNTLYIAQGGLTNMGAPSNNFAYLPEFALSAAILSVDLDAIGDTTYDLPTLDDEDHPGADPNDPFGGNDGKNQAILVPGGPVQVYAPGFRNPYDVVITEDGKMYSVDNGPNAGWGGIPNGEGTTGEATNDPKNGGNTYGDSLHYITGEGYYGGHPNPTRSNTDNTFNDSNPQSPVSEGNDIESDYRQPGSQNGALHVWGSSTNGLTEYTASNFQGSLKGDLLAASFNNSIKRVKLNAAGDQAALEEQLFSSAGSVPLDVTAVGDNGKFPGTIWVAAIGSGKIHVFEPADYMNDGIIVPQNPDDTDGDGYLNDDEIANGTNPENAADYPADWDSDFTSNLLDDDDDNDGLLDHEDPFAIDPDNGLTTAVGVSHTWENEGSDIGGLINAGFTGLMTNGIDDYESLFDTTQLTSGGAAGVLTMDMISEGDATGSLNTQEQAFQLGVNVASATSPVTAHSRILAPFGDDTPQGQQSMGMFIGNGDQDNYFKIVVSATGITTQLEVGGVVTTGPSANLELPGPAGIDLYLTVDVANSTVTASYDVDGAGRTVLGSPIAIPASWLTSATQGMAAGIISTSVGSAPAIPATWDLIEVVAESPSNLAPILAGIADPTLMAGSTQQVTITASDPDSNDIALSIDNLPSYATFVDHGNGTGTLTLAPESGDVGSDSLTVTATDNGSPSLSDSQVVNVTVNAVPPPMPGGEVIHRVNAGGNAVNDDPTWQKDDSYTNSGAAGSKGYSTSAGINLSDPSVPEGTPEAIFKTERYDPSSGQEMQYNFAVDPGQYEVRLYFAETYGSTSGVGKRVFDVLIEGVTVLDDYDIFADVGKNKGVMKSFVITADTNIDIDFLHEKQNPLVRAIEIVSIGAASPGVLSTSLTALDFGTVPTGGTATQSFALVNLGESGDPAITVNTADLVFSGPGAGAYSVLTTGTLTIPAGGSAFVDVEFAPNTSGAKSASLAIAHSGTNSPLSVSLTGSGAAPAAETASVYIDVDSGGSLSSSSTYSSGSFDIENNSSGGQRIASVRFDIDSALLPDVVFDPFGTAGDPVGKDFTVNSGGGSTGVDGHTFDKALHTGFQALEIAFDDFDPGESISFSIDIDPTTIRGANDPGPEASGSVSGMELSGSLVTITFEDGSVLTTTLFRKAGSDTGGETTAEANTLTTPTLEILGLGSTPTTTTTANQVVRVTGAVGSTVRLLHAEAALHLAGVPGGGYDVDPYESNKVIGLTEQTIVIGGGGFTDVPITLLNTDDEGGLNHLMAVAVDGDVNSEADHLQVQYNPEDVENDPPVLALIANQSVTEGETVIVSITATDPNNHNLQFSTTNLPSYASLVDNGNGTATLTLAPQAGDAGMTSFIVTVTDDGNPALTDNQSVTVTVEEEIIVDPQMSEVVYRVNAGGSPIGGDPNWTGDGGFVNSGSKTYSTSHGIDMSHASLPAEVPESLFKSERYDPGGGGEMEWDFDVEAGQYYEVRLYFADTYTGTFGVGKRVFDVAIDGNIVLDDYDIYAKVGGYAGVMESFVIQSDGNIDIDFFHENQNPTIKGIEILEINQESGFFV
ncbi:malectin domain-containing carbohydrate-binding protein [Aeoliella sp.]|uniref:malectin domain-containing carbohydrate-binding protein n=1 Tax=Aeoliella sp. TaxID=2795800 RepID=UPI003CCBFC78